MQSDFSPKKPYSSGFKRLISGTVIVLMSCTLVLTFSKTAHAGLISFISGLFQSQKASAKVNQPISVPNSQTIALLQPAINIDPNPDKPAEMTPVLSGETLIADVAETNAVKSNDTLNTQISTYIVQNGDTVSGVAKMFNVSVNTVLWANDLTSRSVLKAGQTLVILPISGITYTVKKGDTIQAIAKKYGSDASEILAYNDMTTSSALIAGDEIIIPNGELSAPPSGSPKPAPGSGLPSYAGYYMRPVIGGIKTQGIHGHNGVDLASSYGASILASAEGDVIISRNYGWNGGYGEYIVISHGNGTQTLYGHLSATLVSAGDHVKQGQMIGRMGNTGDVHGPTGIHLHFEIRGARNPF